MARNRKGWYECGCCPLTYNDVEIAKGSHYEIGDDDDMPYKRRKKKAREPKTKPHNKCGENKNHLFVWVKYMHQNYREEKSLFMWKYLLHVRYAEPGEFVSHYEFRCVGCGAIRKTAYPGRRCGNPVPHERDIYEVRHRDKYGNRLI